MYTIFICARYLKTWIMVRWWRCKMHFSIVNARVLSHKKYNLRILISTQHCPVCRMLKTAWKYVYNNCIFIAINFVYDLRGCCSKTHNKKVSVSVFVYTRALLCASLRWLLSHSVNNNFFFIYPQQAKSWI